MVCCGKRIKGDENMEQVTIRRAVPEDAEALLKIYAPYVTETAVSFEYAVPALEEFRERIVSRLGVYPYLVAETAGKPVGYAYAGSFHPRAAYRYAAEASIYISPNAHGQGIGRALYTELEKRLARQNICVLYACIAYTERTDDPFLTDASIRFHEKMGYQCVGTHHLCGYKFGRWYSMRWYEKVIAPRPEHPDDILPEIPETI